MRNKKAQGLSINTIIIAAIAVLVLVLLVLIFTGRMRTTTDELERCSNSGGSCRLVTSANPSPCGKYEEERSGKDYSDCKDLMDNSDGKIYVCCRGIGD